MQYLLQILHLSCQTHYEKSDWSRAFNQFTTACEFDMINAISAADIVTLAAHFNETKKKKTKKKPTNVPLAR